MRRSALLTWLRRRRAAAADATGADLYAAALAHLTLDDAAAALWEDSVGVGHVTRVQAATAAVPGVFGSAADFSGVAATARECGSSNATVYRRGDTTYTFSLWVRANSWGGPDRTVLSQSIGGAWGYRLATDAAGNLEWRVRGAGTISLGALPTGQDVYLEVGHNHTTNQLWYRIDDGPKVSAATSGAAATSTDAFNLGGDNDSPSTRFDGWTDDVALFDVELTDQQSAYRYNGGAGRTFPYGVAAAVPDTVYPINGNTTAITGDDLLQPTGSGDDGVAYTWDRDTSIRFVGSITDLYVRSNNSDPSMKAAVYRDGTLVAVATMGVAGVTRWHRLATGLNPAEAEYRIFNATFGFPNGTVTGIGTSGGSGLVLDPLTPLPVVFLLGDSITQPLEGVLTPTPLQSTAEGWAQKWAVGGARQVKNAGVAGRRMKAAAEQIDTLKLGVTTDMAEVRVCLGVNDYIDIQDATETLGELQAAVETIAAALRPQLGAGKPIRFVGPTTFGAYNGEVSFDQTLFDQVEAAIAAGVAAAADADVTFHSAEGWLTDVSVGADTIDLLHTSNAGAAKIAAGHLTL